MILDWVLRSLKSAQAMTLSSSILVYFSRFMTLSSQILAYFSRFVTHLLGEPALLSRQDYIRSPPDCPNTLRSQKANAREVVGQIIKKSCSKLALVGPPGIGKTWTARAIIHHKAIIAKFSAQRHWVSCMEDTQLEAICEGLQKQIELLPENPQFIVLDNFDAIWDRVDLRVETEHALGDIYALPNVTVLITMRGITKPDIVDWELRIYPLNLEDARKLFFAIHRHSDSYLDNLLKRLDYVPLSIATIAGIGLIYDLSPSQLLPALAEEPKQELNINEIYFNSLKLSSLETALSRCSADTRKLLGILSLLPAGLSTEQAHYLFPNPTTLEESFTSHSLAAFYKGRFMLLSNVRPYLLRYHKLDSASRQQLYSYYFERMEQNLCEAGDEPFVTAIQVFSIESSNIEAVLSDALDYGGEIELEATLRYTNLLCSTAPDLHIIEKAIKLAQQTPSKHLSRLLERHGDMLSAYSRFDDGRSSFDKAIDAYRRTKDDLGAIRCMVKTGSSLNRCHTFHNEGLETMEQALRLCEQIGDVSLVKGECLLSLAQAYLAKGRIEDGHKVIVEASSIFDAHQMKLKMAECKVVMNHILFEKGRSDIADCMYDDALLVYRQLRDHEAIAKCLLGTSQIRIQQGRLEDAEVAVMEAVEIFRRLDRRVDEAFALRLLGSVYRKQRKYDSAITAFERAIGLFWEAYFIFGAGESEADLGITHVLAGHFSEARVSLHIALKTNRNHGDDARATLCLYGLIICYDKLGQTDEAKRLASSSCDALQKYWPLAVLSFGDQYKFVLVKTSSG